MAGPDPNALKPNIVTVPNLLSAFRILCVPVFLRAVLRGRALEALLVFFVAGLTDLLDGLAARAWHQRSRLGTVLDPAGDKLLTAASYIVLTIPSVAGPNHIPLWLTATIFLRDLLIVGGALYARLTWGQKTFAPSLWGKLTTGCQVGTILLVLLLNVLGTAPGIMLGAYGITLFWTLVSGTHYFAVGLSILRSRRS